MARHTGADFDNAHHGFVAGHGRFVIGHIMRHFRQRLRINPADHRGFAGVAGELFEQFQIGKAEADHLNPPQQLWGPGSNTGSDLLTPTGRSDQLHGSLFLWNSRGCHKSSVDLCQNLVRGSPGGQAAHPVFARGLQFASQQLKEHILGLGARKVFFAHSLR